MTEEDEAFNEIERRSRVKQDILMHPSKEAMLTVEVAVLTEMVRVLSDKVNELQILNQPTWFIDSKHTPPQRTWVALTDDEIFEIHKQVDSMQYLTFGHAIEAKLKEKNT